MNLTHILATTDFSDGSKSALERGFMIANTTEARYSVIHAVDDSAIGSLRRFFEETLAANPKNLDEKFREQLNQIVSDASIACNVRPELQLEHGTPWAVVCNLAEEADVGLIVVGAHGSGLFSQSSPGSTVLRILHQSTKPVLVVKSRPMQAYKKLLVPTDFSPVSAGLIRLARSIAPEAEVILMHAFEEPMFSDVIEYNENDQYFIDHYRERAHEELQELAAASGLSSSEFSVLIVRGDAKRQIVAHANHFGCDLIVMGKHGSGVIDELLLGSVANRVLADAKSDVLIAVDTRDADGWRYRKDERKRTRLLQGDRFDISGLDLGHKDELRKRIINEFGNDILHALREAFGGANGLDLSWGATLTQQGLDVRPLDLIMTLPFARSKNDWGGPLLLISLETIVQEQIDRFDASGSAQPEPEELMKVRDGLRMLANRLNQARVRNATKIDRRIEQKAPLF